MPSVTTNNAIECQGFSAWVLTPHLSVHKIAQQCGKIKEEE